jgi:hypothetical protein
MKLQRIPRRYLKPQERRRIAERCERSGLSRREFARRRRISVTSLNRWFSEARNDRKEVGPVFFREVTASPPLPPAPSGVWAVEIVGPSGVTVRCREGMSVQDLALLLGSRTC